MHRRRILQCVAAGVAAALAAPRSLDIHLRPAEHQFVDHRKGTRAGTDRLVRRAVIYGGKHVQA